MLHTSVRPFLLDACPSAKSASAPVVPFSARSVREKQQAAPGQSIDGSSISKPMNGPEDRKEPRRRTATEERRNEAVETAPKKKGPWKGTTFVVPRNWDREDRL